MGSLPQKTVAAVLQTVISVCGIGASTYLLAAHVLSAGAGVALLAAFGGVSLASHIAAGGRPN